MDEAGAVVLGAQIAGIVAVVVAIVGFVGQALLERQRRKHERRAAAGQRAHEWRLARRQDVAAAYLSFAAALRRAEHEAVRSMHEHYGQSYGDQVYTSPAGEPVTPEREEAEVEATLAVLRLYASDELYLAAARRLEWHMRIYWSRDESREAALAPFPVDHLAAQEALSVAARREFGDEVAPT